MFLGFFLFFGLNFVIFYLASCAFFVLLIKAIIFGWLKLLLCGLILKNLIFYTIANQPFSRFALSFLFLKSTQYNLINTYK